MSTPYKSPVQGNVTPGTPAGKSVVTIILIVLGVMLALAVCVIAALAALLMPAISAARSAAQRTQAQNQLRIVSNALLNYESIHQQFPNSETTAPDGTALHSWRTAILPFLEQSNIHNQIQMDKAWNSPENRALSERSIREFATMQCADSVGTNRTAIVAVVGDDTVIRPDGTVTFASITKGASNTAMILCLLESDIPWAEPRDVSVEEAIRLIQSAPQGNWLAVGMADGSVTSLGPSTSSDTIRQLFSCTP